MWVFIADLYFTKKQAYFRYILAENVVSEICLEHELLWPTLFKFNSLKAFRIVEELVAAALQILVHAGRHLALNCAFISITCKCILGLVQLYIIFIYLR